MTPITPQLGRQVVVIILQYYYNFAKISETANRGGDDIRVGIIL